jgi:hypothetical protein
MSFEWSLKGYFLNDNAVGAHRPSLFVRLRTLAASGIFLVTLFFAVDHIDGINMEQLQLACKVKCTTHYIKKE